MISHEGRSYLSSGRGCRTNIPVLILNHDRHEVISVMIQLNHDRHDVIAVMIQLSGTAN